MTMSASGVRCLHWCETHEIDDDGNGDDGGGVMVRPRSRLVTWSDRPEYTANIERTDGCGGDIPVGIHMESELGELNEITADEARRVAAALVNLADELERG